MTEFADFLTTLHGVNRWLILGAGSLALGVSIAGLLRHRFGRLERGTLTAFLATLGLQAVLGLLIVVGLASDGLEPFGGSGGTLVAHAADGVFGITFAGLAFFLSRRRSDGRAAARTAAIWTGLAVVSVGDFAITLPVAAAVAVLRFVTTRHASATHEVVPEDEPQLTRQKDGAIS